GRGGGERSSRGVRPQRRTILDAEGEVADRVTVRGRLGPGAVDRAVGDCGRADHGPVDRERDAPPEVSGGRVEFVVVAFLHLADDEPGQGREHLRPRAEILVAEIFKLVRPYD